VKFMKKLSEPRSFSNTIGNSTILSLSAGARHGVLTLGGPGDQVVAEEHGIARGGLASVRAAGPVSIRVNHQVVLGRRPKTKPQVQSAPNVAEDALESGQMGLSRVMHV
jgi:hypothetical protein